MYDFEIGDFITKAQTVLHDNTPLNDWCFENYGKLPELFVGVNEIAPPEESSIPHIILFPGDPAHEGGSGNPREMFRFYILWCIRDESVTQVDRVTEYAGVKKCSHMGKLIWDCVRRMSPNCPAVISDVGIYGTATHPLYPGTMTIEFGMPALMNPRMSI
ncbi:MAG: hypothetical protein AB9917_02190 [Negativicutes bacterium]